MKKTPDREAPATVLIRCRALDVVDDKNIDWTLRRFELEPELFV
jgi:hypothetical protein